MERKGKFGLGLGLMIAIGLTMSQVRSWGQSAETEVQGEVILRMISVQPVGIAPAEFNSGGPIPETNFEAHFIDALKAANPQWEIHLLGEASNRKGVTSGDIGAFEGQVEVPYMSVREDGRIHAVVSAHIHGMEPGGYDLGSDSVLNLELEGSKAYQIFESRKQGHDTRILVFASLIPSDES